MARISGVWAGDVIAALKDLGTVYQRRVDAERALTGAQGQLETAGRSIDRARQEIKDLIVATQ